MYYLMVKSKKTVLPQFHYIFKSFKFFYEIAYKLDYTIFGKYIIQVNSESYEKVVEFIRNEQLHEHLIVYVQISETMLSYINMRMPSVNKLDSKSNYIVYSELVEELGIYFDKDCMQLLYGAIPHTYEDLKAALLDIKEEYGDGTLITRNLLNKLFVIEDKVFPRTVLIEYLRMRRWRESKLNKCIEVFGNDLVYYAMRKTARALLKDKINYYKTGEAGWVTKAIPADNLILMLRALDYEHGKFKDIRAILNLYEKGETVNDTIQKRTY